MLTKKEIKAVHEYNVTCVVVCLRMSLSYNRKKRLQYVYTLAEMGHVVLVDPLTQDRPGR